MRPTLCRGTGRDAYCSFEISCPSICSAFHLFPDLRFLAAIFSRKLGNCTFDKIDPLLLGNRKPALGLQTCEYAQGLVQPSAWIVTTLGQLHEGIGEIGLHRRADGVLGSETPCYINAFAVR